MVNFAKGFPALRPARRLTARGGRITLAPTMKA
jgi:hypothetical protein